MRVLYVTNSFALETFLHPEIRALRATGIDVDVFSLRELSTWPWDPLKSSFHAPAAMKHYIHRMSRDGWLAPPSLLKNTAATLLAAGIAGSRSPADCIHAYWASAPATLALVLSKFWDVPFSFTGHRWDIYANQMLRSKSSDASFVRVISSRGGDVLCKTVPGVGHKLKLVRVGIDILTEPLVARAQQNSWRMLAVGSLLPVKDHMSLLSAMEVLGTQGLDPSLDLVGEGPERHRLENRVRNSPALSGRVRFLGRRTHADTLALMRHPYSALVHSSRSSHGGVEEGIPVVVLEAAAKNLPIVATMSGATEEFLTEATGWPCPPNSAHDLARTIGDAIAQPAEARRRAEIARALVASDWNAQTTSRELAGLFSSSLRPRVRGAE